MVYGFIRVALADDVIEQICQIGIGRGVKEGLWCSVSKVHYRLATFSLRVSFSYLYYIITLKKGPPVNLVMKPKQAISSWYILMNFADILNQNGYASLIELIYKKCFSEAKECAK